MERNISSVSLDEKTGTVKIIIDGEIPIIKGVDDPVVELFRPIRLKYVEDVFFTILATHTKRCVTCTLIPSNRRNRSVNELLKVALTALKGDDNKPGILEEYQNILEAFFDNPNGLDLYLIQIERIEEDGDNEHSLCSECNDNIKAFVKKYGLEMPSRKKPKKTKAEKRASGRKYLEAHPEILCSNKKPAN